MSAVKKDAGNEGLKIVSFRPGVISNRTAFDCMAMIYKYLQSNHDYKFTIVKSVTDVFMDDQLNVISIPIALWKPMAGLPIFRPFVGRKRILDKVFADCDLLLTIDPTITSQYQGLLALKAAERLGKPIWFDTSLTNVGQGRELRWRIVRPFVRAPIHDAAGIIAPVPKCLERFADIGLFDSKLAALFTIMGHPVDTTRFTPAKDRVASDRVASDRVHIIVISRLVPEKGLHHILDAVTTLVQEELPIDLCIVGDGPMKPFLQRVITERGFSDRVRFVSPVAHEDVPGLLKDADIFVSHPAGNSHWEEFFGAANLEAMACGLACILSRSGGVPSAINDPEAALLVPERDIAALTDAIRNVVKNCELRQRLASRGREYVERYYSLPIIAERYRRMLVDGLERHRHRMANV